MTTKEALDFVRKEGLVLESASGRVPSLAETVAGERAKGSWWSHPRGHEIFRLTRAVRASDEVLVCRLVDGKITYLHRRLWPALVRLAGAFDPRRITAVQEVHTERGHHEVEEVPFPEWVPESVLEAARSFDEAEAKSHLPSWLLEAWAG